MLVCPFGRLADRLTVSVVVVVVDVVFVVVLVANTLADVPRIIEAPLISNFRLYVFVYVDKYKRARVPL